MRTVFEITGMLCYGHGQKLVKWILKSIFLKPENMGKLFVMFSNIQSKKKWIWISVCIVAGALLGTVFIYVAVWIELQYDHQIETLQQKGNPTNIEELRKFCEVVPPEENGLCTSIKAKQSFVDFDIGSSMWYVIGYSFQDYNHLKDNSEIQNYLKTNEKTLKLIDELIKYKHLKRNTEPEDPLDFCFFGLNGVRDFIRLQKFKCLEAVRLKQYPAALNIINKGNKIRELAWDDPSLIAFLVGMAVEAIRQGMVIDLLNSNHVSSSEIQNEIVRLKQIEKRIPELFNRVLVFEQGAMLCSMLGEKFSNSNLKFYIKMNIIKFIKTSSLLIDLVPFDYYQIKSELNAYEKKRKELPLLYSICKMLLNSGTILRHPSALKASLRCMRTSLALELYRRKHGKYPDSLEQLVPKFIAGVPIDPFDGKPLRYFKGKYDFMYKMLIKSEDGYTGKKVSRPVDGCYIYSIGKNCCDDGGCPGTVYDYRKKDDLTFALSLNNDI